MLKVRGTERVRQGMKTETTKKITVEERIMNKNIYKNNGRED